MRIPKSISHIEEVLANDFLCRQDKDLYSELNSHELCELNLKLVIECLNLDISNEIKLKVNDKKFLVQELQTCLEEIERY